MTYAPFFGLNIVVYIQQYKVVMDTVRSLDEKRERVLEQMRALRSMRRGSVTEQYLKVRHKGKRKPVVRGPYWTHTWKEGGKTAYSSHRERRFQSKLNSESGEAERSSKR